MRFLYSVAALLALILPCTAAAETPGRVLRTLTTAHEAHDISLEEAAHGFLFEFVELSRITILMSIPDMRHSSSTIRQGAYSSDYLPIQFFL